jgi:predicted metalloendopeptidase
MSTALVVFLVLSANPIGADAGTEQESPGAPTTGAAEVTPERVAQEVRSAMDGTADPCQDFYRYACGGWLDATERPADEAIWTRSFSTIVENNREVVREIVEDARANPGDDPDRQRIGYFYGSCMDEASVDEAGTEPLLPIFEEISKVKDSASLLSVVGKLHRRNVETLFEVHVIPDFKDPDLNISFLWQGGLGMPDRDYYVSEEEVKKELLAAYEAHVARMLGLLGDDEESAKRQAAAILSFETELAKASRSAQEMRIVEKLYNKLDIGGLKELTPTLLWDSYLGAIGYPDILDISVATPEFFEALEKLIGETEMPLIHSYLRWHALRSHARLLSKPVVGANFEFYGKKLAGQEEIKPRWKRCVEATQNALGELVGKLYVERRFAGESKAIATEMILDIEKAFEGNLPRLAWMDDATRGQAMSKVEAVGNKIGYPDEWRDYSSLKLEPGSYYRNALAAFEFEFDRQTSKVGQAVDPNEWEMTPQMVNAYYHPLHNEIVFPAGILQPPFFHRGFPAAMNYGAIGGVIGHELTHGFDDQGRKFDPEGQLNDWWQPEVVEKFSAQAQCIDDFYSGYEIEPGVKVNGKLTLGENIADIGGLKQAHMAYKLWEERHGTPEAVVEGLTSDQLFFVAWGQVWCTLASPEIERVQVTTDPHSPGRFRVVGPVSNNRAFAEAFGCEPDQPMSPDDICVVW